MKPKIYRQGDVLIERVGRKPEGGKSVPRENGRIIIAHGEATGHAHAICEPGVEMVELESGERFVCSETGIRVVHEEHGTIALPPGNYRITQQREYTPEAIRNVAD